MYTVAQVGMRVSIRSECLMGPDSAGSTFYPCQADRADTLCRMRKALDHSVTDAPHLDGRPPGRVTRPLYGRVDLCMLYCFKCVQAAKMLTSCRLSVAPSGISPCSR